MKRIAIISSFAWIKVANNYGALLQYYALQQYLYNKGHYAFWIKYVMRPNRYAAFKGFVRHFLKNPEIQRESFICHKSFMQYCQDYLNLSEETFTADSIKRSYPSADFYITGSDQVWGGTLAANYLTFVDDDDKKIAYAASFGKSEISIEQAEKIRPWVKSFKHVSVREESGVGICKSLGCRAEHLLDPTLLLDAEKYPHTDRIVSDKYVFSYFLNVSSLDNVRWTEIQEYAHDTNMELKVCSVQGSQYLFRYKDLVFPSPIEWLTYYRDAEMIITNTFHGTVFAIIHRRPFVCVLQSGHSAKQNTRMNSLLSMFGLSDRILKPDGRIEDIANQEINWTNVDETLSLWRYKTDRFFEFLEN